MASLTGTGAAGGQPTATCVDGLYIRDLSLERYLEIVQALDDAGEDPEVPPKVVSWRMFDWLICDADGNRFDDFPTEADATDITLTQARAFRAAFDDFVDHLGKGRRATPGS